jgi:hypothetical protein
MHTTLPGANYISSALHSYAYAKSRMNKYANEKKQRDATYCVSFPPTMQVSERSFLLYGNGRTITRMPCLPDEITTAAWQEVPRRHNWFLNIIWQTGNGCKYSRRTWRIVLTWWLCSTRWHMLLFTIESGAWIMIGFNSEHCSFSKSINYMHFISFEYLKYKFTLAYRYITLSPFSSHTSRDYNFCLHTYLSHQSEAPWLEKPAY